jgi:hypothetical protein
MGQLSYLGAGFAENQLNNFKLSVSAACRKMTDDQILDLADQLHDIIRKRGACCMSHRHATFDLQSEDDDLRRATAQ